MDRKRRAIVLHFYPRSPCGERLQDGGRVIVMVDISIHALLAESDIDTSKDVIKTANFYPRSPCGERLMFVNLRVVDGSFLSTLSLRRATAIILCIAKQCRNFYPRSPCGERPSVPHWLTPHQQFLSTLSLRRATDKRCKLGRDNRISIHALLAESDVRPRYSPAAAPGFLSTLSLRRATPCHGGLHESRNYFYPRSPCGERPLYDLRALLSRSISIHALLAESDSEVPEDQYTSLSISIHALLAESDHSGNPEPGRDLDFYPRSPCGERLPAGLGCYRLHSISIHALLAESDFSSPNTSIIILDISIHALLAESDGRFDCVSCCIHKFLSTLSLRRATHFCSAAV